MYNKITLTYADLKGTEIAESVRNFAVQVMKDAPTDRKKPVLDISRILDNVVIPEDIRTAVQERNGAIPTMDDVAALAYDAWKHQDDNINDLYTYRLETLYGVKNITYKNEHPTVAQLEEINDGFSEFYKDEIDDGEPEDSIIYLIAMEVADYVLGEDFRIFFNEKLDLLHTDMREDFIEDAKRILTELKQTIQQ